MKEKRPFLTMKPTQKEVMHSASRLIKSVQNAPITDELWEKTKSDALKEDAKSPLSRLIEDIEELIKSSGYTLPSTPDEKTPAEIAEYRALTKMSKDFKNYLHAFPNVKPDDKMARETAELIPFIVACSTDTQTSLWNAYRAARAAEQALNDKKYAVAAETLIYLADKLTRGATYAIADERRKSNIKAANVGHKNDRKNMQIVREWYRKRVAADDAAGRKRISKDTAAKKIISEELVHAEFRTIRKYLNNQ